MKNYEVKRCYYCGYLCVKEMEKCHCCGGNDFKPFKVTKTDYDILKRIFETNKPP